MRHAECGCACRSVVKVAAERPLNMAPPEVAAAPHPRRDRVQPSGRQSAAIRSTTPAPRSGSTSHTPVSAEVGAASESDGAPDQWNGLRGLLARRCPTQDTAVPGPRHGGQRASRPRQRLAPMHRPPDFAPRPMAAPQTHRPRPGPLCNASPPARPHTPRLNSGRFLPDYVMSDSVLSVGRRDLHDRRCAGPASGFGDFSDPDARGFGVVGRCVSDRRRRDFCDPSNVRTSAQSRVDFGGLPRGHTLYSEMRIATEDSTTPWCANHIQSWTPGAGQGS